MFAHARNFNQKKVSFSVSVVWFAFGSLDDFTTFYSSQWLYCVAFHSCMMIIETRGSFIALVIIPMGIRESLWCYCEA